MMWTSDIDHQIFVGPVFFGGEVCPFYNMDEFLCNHNDMFMMVVYGNEKS